MERREGERGERTTWREIRWRRKSRKGRWVKRTGEYTEEKWKEGTGREEKEHERR